MERRLVSSGAPWERTYGYSRAVAAGRQVYVSGTAPVMPGNADPPADAYGQARRCLEIILDALAEAGAGAKDVVRTRVYVVRADDFDEAYRAHAEVFGDVRPATAGLVIAGLLDPRWLVEIEVDAVIG
jgi:enamine deaminase RidA (YjgF/YER057c/UK114 family)